MAIARDRFWLFGVRPHQDDIYLGNTDNHLPYMWSRITPGEAALMLDIPNVIMVNCDGVPAPFSAEAYGYAESFCRMQNVLWSSTGSAGFRAGNEEAFVCELAGKYPNIAGAYMDDFFGRFANDPEGDDHAEAMLREIRTGLSKAPRPMELYVTWYTFQFDVSPKLLSYIDGLTLWTWNCEELPQLEERFEKIEKAFPDKKKLLGIYMYDFPTKKPVSDELMALQCDLGLRLMQEGRLDGMIFEANSVMGVGLSSELWLRGWLESHKNAPVPD